MAINSDYQRDQMKCYFWNQYAYFNEDSDEQFLEPLLDELGIHVFMDADHGHKKVTSTSITGLFSVVVSTPITWSYKRQTAVQTSTFGANFTALKNSVKAYVVLWYHLR